MRSPLPRTVLITGASSGIGRATALILHARGHRVLAGVRRLADAPPGPEPLLLDVTKPEHIAAARARVSADGLFALINNAGHNYTAPLEYTDEAKARAMMDANLFGLAALTQALLPALRQGVAQHGSARVLNIGSIGSLVGIPWEPWYHASKFAVLGLSESLRSEVYRQKILVTVVCPGGIRTPFLAKSGDELRASLDALPPEGRLLYGKGLSAMVNLTKTADRMGSSPEHVGREMAKLLDHPAPPFRKLVGADAKMIATLRRVLPRRAFHAMLRSAFGC